MSAYYEGKTCIITGASGAMGSETARRMAKAGCNLALLDVSEQRLNALAEELRSENVAVLPLAVDLARKESIDQAIEKVFACFPVVHMLINCAGISTMGKLVDMDLDAYDREQAINCRSILILAQHAARNMIENRVEDGRIISISSQSGKRGEDSHGSYCISKAGVVMMTQVLGLELAEYGIAVTAISPGMVDTPMLRGLINKDNEGFLEVGRQAIPMKRFAQAGEIADLIMFLSSREAGYITGVTISIAGGTILY